MSRQFTATHLAVAAALALVVGGSAGYFLAPDGTEQTISADSACPEVNTSDSASGAFSRLVGSGEKVRSTATEKGSVTNSYSYSCSVQVNGRGRLLLSAELTDSGSVSDWRTDLEKNGDIGSKKDYKSFTLGRAGSGVASPFSAAIYLPCDPAGSKLTVKPNLSVEVTKLDRGGDADTNRSDAAEVARALAAHAQSGARCEDAERLGTVKWA
ncbi:hypothetical protein EV284_2287 [Streptomyces sp. BK022]|uniref:hypothetical protein n=1 Tax=Streptomyces sp. BK022 TaxID=2512123 RepID=UPI00102A13B9|nr:hypothetical protein [Streptomyces sp. BK022]RZU44811.1 hypothetical protein EV284_2287 [Streptomyces sp. BK022]